jgi:hypothetical protein
MNSKWILALLAAGLMGTAQAANAAPITITNNSFEANTVTSAGSYRNANATISNWTKFGTGSHLLSSSSSTLIHPLDGVNLVELQGASPMVADMGFYQDLSTTFAADTTYTFSMTMGGFTGQTNNNFGGIWLETSSGTILASATLVDPEYGHQGTAQYATISLTYTTPSTAGPIGDTIRVAFAKLAGAATLNVVAFDDAKLDAVAATTSVPEPASLTLLGIGGLCLLKRRGHLA